MIDNFSCFHDRSLKLGNRNWLTRLLLISFCVLFIAGGSVEVDLSIFKLPQWQLNRAGFLAVG